MSRCAERSFCFWRPSRWSTVDHPIHADASATAVHGLRKLRACVRTASRAELSSSRAAAAVYSPSLALPDTNEGSGAHGDMERDHLAAQRARVRAAAASG